MRPNSYEAYIYVDAQYIRKELKHAGKRDTFDPSVFWQMTAAVSADSQPIRAVRLFFYEAIDESMDDQSKKDLQDYLEHVEAISYVSVVTGFVRQGKRKPKEQKGIDVQIAVDALEAASTKRADAIILVAGDADFCPLAEAVRRTGAFMIVFGFERASQELRRSADVFGVLPEPATLWKCF